MAINLLSARESILFRNIAEDDLEKLFKCLSARELEFERDSIILHAGEEVRSVYYILSGSVHIIDEDFWGNRSIIETMQTDTLFGEAYVFSSMENHLVSIIAAERATIMEIDPIKLFETCSNSCSYHTTLVRNTLTITSEKIVRLTEKLGHIMRRTIREKLLSYLSVCAQSEKSSSFHIPYSRQQLADYLCIDRSALSHELSRLKKQGLIQYHKNHFELLLNHEDL
jgi:cAMP-binding proteins - catabolite gene activator and regulatory subunit of cAMP-dependent protein kinases